MKKKTTIFLIKLIHFIYFFIAIKNNAMAFKIKVFSMIELFTKKKPQSPLILSLILPLIRGLFEAQANGEKQVFSFFLLTHFLSFNYFLKKKMNK